MTFIYESNQQTVSNNTNVRLKPSTNNNKKVEVNRMGFLILYKIPN